MHFTFTNNFLSIILVLVNFTQPAYNSSSNLCNIIPEIHRRTPMSVYDLKSLKLPVLNGKALKIFADVACNRLTTVFLTRRKNGGIPLVLAQAWR